MEFVLLFVLPLLLLLLHTLLLLTIRHKFLLTIYTTERNNFKDGKLNYQKILALNALDFIWNRIESAWYEKYAQLCKYQETYGHCNVVSIIDRTLAEWTQRQRREYRRLNGTSLTMTQTRIHALEKVPNWGWGKTKDDRPSFGTSDECDSSS